MNFGIYMYNKQVENVSEISERKLELLQTSCVI